jgi:hypothetical protein
MSYVMSERVSRGRERAGRRIPGRRPAAALGAVAQILADPVGKRE